MSEQRSGNGNGNYKDGRSLNKRNIVKIKVGYGVRIIEKNITDICENGRGKTMPRRKQRDRE